MWAKTIVESEYGRAGGYAEQRRHRGHRDEEYHVGQPTSTSDGQPRHHDPHRQSERAARDAVPPDQGNGANSSGRWMMVRHIATVRRPGSDSEARFPDARVRR